MNKSPKSLFDIISPMDLDHINSPEQWLDLEKKIIAETSKLSDRAAILMEMEKEKTSVARQAQTPAPTKQNTRTKGGASQSTSSSQPSSPTSTAGPRKLADILSPEELKNLKNLTPDQYHMIVGHIVDRSYNPAELDSLMKELGPEPKLPSTPTSPASTSTTVNAGRPADNVSTSTSSRTRTTTTATTTTASSSGASSASSAASTSSMPKGRIVTSGTQAGSAEVVDAVEHQARVVDDAVKSVKKAGGRSLRQGDGVLSKLVAGGIKDAGNLKLAAIGSAIGVGMYALNRGLRTQQDNIDERLRRQRGY